MAKTVIQFTVLFITLVLAQAIIFNHVCLYNVALPFLFIYFIIRLPITLSPNWVMTLGFLLGATIDIFSDTLGMNALACTIIAALRRPVLRLYIPRDEDMPQSEPVAALPGSAHLHQVHGDRDTAVLHAHIHDRGLLVFQSGAAAHEGRMLNPAHISTDIRNRQFNHTPP